MECGLFATVLLTCKVPNPTPVSESEVTWSVETVERFVTGGHGRS